MLVQLVLQCFYLLPFLRITPETNKGKKPDESDAPENPQNKYRRQCCNSHINHRFLIRRTKIRIIRAKSGLSVVNTPLNWRLCPYCFRRTPVKFAAYQ